MSNSKEAIAIVLDIGPSMVKLGGDVNHLRQACHLVTLILQRKLFSESKDEVSLVMFGTEKSKNDLTQQLGGYNHVSIDTNLSTVTFELIEQFKKFTVPEISYSADFVDALIVAMDDLREKTINNKSFVGKRIILLSSLYEAFSSQKLDDIIASLKEQEIEFTFLGPDDTGSMEAVKVVSRIIDAVEGDQFTFNEVYPCLSSIQSRSIRPTAWKASLTIANNLCIPVCLYTKVKEFKPRTFSKVWSKDPNVVLQRLTTYHLSDSSPVTKEDLIDGYRYGTSLIPLTADDKKAATLKTDKCFKVLGFTKLENVKRHQYFGDSIWTCMAEKGNKPAQVLLSSLIHALYETNMVAIVRRVYSGRSEVHLGCLLPQISAQHEFMYYIQLPFFEDIRQSPFKPLFLEPSPTNDRAFNEEQQEAVDKLIDCMNLSESKENGGDDDKEELFSDQHVYNPYLQRLYQCIEHRALSPDDVNLPPIPPAIQSLLQLPEHKVTASKPAMERIKQLFKIEELTKVEAVKNETKSLEDNKSLNQLEAFRNILNDSESPPKKAFDLIFSIASSLLEPTCYDQLSECLALLRKHYTNGGRHNYNDFIRLLKKTIADKKDLGFWPNITNKNLGLVTKQENSSSEVAEEEAKAFLAVDA